jgi:hypothetical protein
MNPVLIGAGIGALGSAVQGKSPLTGALMGGATGGLFGGSESLLGGKIASAFGQGATAGVTNGITAATGELAKQAIPSVGIQGLGQGLNYADDLALNQLDDFALGSADDMFNLNTFKSGLPKTPVGVQLSAGDLRGGLPSANMPFADRINAMNTSQLFNYTDPTMMDKIQGFGNDAFSFAKSNPATTGGYALKGVEAINAPPEKVNTSAQQPVRQGQFQGYTPTASASNVAPQIVPVPVNKTGMLQLDSVVAQNPELRKLYPDLFGG